MDAFYASVEQRDNPDYRGRPIAVGGSPKGRGGVVATASYEARRYGVRSAMPSRRAAELCPGLVFVYPRFEVYKDISAAVREIFARYTDLIEPLSLDEAYLDVTSDKRGVGSALEIAREIKAAIRDELGLTASAGISVNKFIAKIASGMNKPDGLTFIGPSRVTAFVERLPVEDFYGVGKVTATRMKELGLHTGADLKRLSESELVHHFGKAGRFYYNIVRGIDDRPVQPHRETKSVGAEDTFATDLRTAEEMEAELEVLVSRVWQRLGRKALNGRTVTLKIRFADFTTITRSHSVASPIVDRAELFAVVMAMLGQAELDDVRVRLLGVSVSNFGDVTSRSSPEEDAGQLTLF